MHEEDVLGKAYDARLMRRLLHYLRPYWRSVLVALVSILAASALQLVPPWLILQVIDVYIPARDTQGLLMIGVLFMTTLIAEFALEFLQTTTLQMTGQRIMYDLRMQIYAHLQRLDVQFFDRNPVGRLMTRVTTDVDALNELFTSGVVSVFGDVFSLTALTAEWMSGQFPFDGDSYPARAVAIQMGTRRPLAVPDGARAFLERGLERDPARRPAVTEWLAAARSLFESLDR